jgi:hypothetical protein
MLKHVRSTKVGFSATAISAAIAAIALFSVSTESEAGPKTFSGCKSAANASPVEAGKGSASWRSFCGGLPTTSPYRGGSCTSLDLESRQAKLGLCGNFELDNGQTP